MKLLLAFDRLGKLLSPDSSSRRSLPPGSIHHSRSDPFHPIQSTSRRNSASNRVRSTIVEEQTRHGRRVFIEEIDDRKSTDDEVDFRCSDLDGTLEFRNIIDRSQQTIPLRLIQCMHHHSDSRLRPDLLEFIHDHRAQQIASATWFDDVALDDHGASTT